MNVPARFATKARALPFALATALCAVLIGGMLWHHKHAAGTRPAARDEPPIGANSRANPAAEEGPEAEGDAPAREKDTEGDTANSELGQRNHPPTADVATLEELRAARQKEFDEYRASVNRRAAERDRAQDAEVRVLLDEITELKNSIVADRAELTKSRESFEKELRELDEKIARLQKKLGRGDFAHDHDGK